ncbi:LysR family transcriptional regulator [Planococcus halocryophilus]|uniref:LysR family transcriptional regulator n=1 Tax=Planococcus halocryophilus TaxID=1215089 RepID=UPI001F0D0736|nr:LysR family transcriptional regulator [Planococcus halocryophilus]MCH4826927.1 LysR family transcriptional regulator [Planococcus halocryophilus]
MELLYFKTLIQVVKSGNYTRAAYALDYSQSSITTHIQKLEAIYGGTCLLERQGNSMKLTPAGEVIYGYAEKLLTLYEESHERLATQEVHTIKIGSIETLAIYKLPTILADFKKRYPNIKVQIQPHTESTIIEKIANKELDFGLIIDRPLHSNMINKILLTKQAMKVIIPSAHPYAKKERMTIDDFKDETIILTEEGCTYRSYLVNQLEERKMNFTISMELSSIETIKKAVQSNWGIGFIPAFSLEKKDKVIGIPFQDENFQFYSQLLYKKSNVSNLAHQYLINLFQKSAL